MRCRLRPGAELSSLGLAGLSFGFGGPTLVVERALSVGARLSLGVPGVAQGADLIADGDSADIVLHLLPLAEH